MSPTGAVEVVVVVEGADPAGVVAAVGAAGVEPLEGCSVGLQSSTPTFEAVSIYSQETNLQSLM